MLAWILEHAGLEPGLPDRRRAAATSASRRGSADSALFVIEADEYDTAFFDKRSKFVHYRPRTAILNNLEFDHADIFADLAAIETPVPPPRAHRAGAAAGSSSTRATTALQRVLARGCWSEVERFGARKEAPGTLRARGEPHAFDVLRGGAEDRPRRVAAARRAQPAERARGDRRGASTSASPDGRGVAALARFAERAGAGSSCAATARGVTVYDDFAHHPTAIATTIDGLRRKVGAARILAVLRAALEHDEARRDEGALPWSLERGRPRVLLRRRASAGTRPRRSRRWARRRGRAPTSTRWSTRSSPRRAPGDHVLVHEQRRLRRHPRQAARRAGAARPRRGMTGATDARRHAGHATCSTCTAFARRRSRPRRASWPPGSPRTGPTLRLVVPAAAGIAGARRWRRARRRHRRPGPRERMAVIGSSLGGFYATAVAERRGCRAVLLNPGRRPGARPRRAHRRDDGVAQRRAASTSAPSTSTSCARSRRRRRSTRPGALLRRHRQGRRGAVVARDERALRRLPHAAARRQRPRAQRLRRPPARRARLPRPRAGPLRPTAASSLPGDDGVDDAAPDLDVEPGQRERAGSRRQSACARSSAAWPRRR